MVKVGDCFLTPTGFKVEVADINKFGMVSLVGEEGRLRLWFLRNKCTKL